MTAPRPVCLLVERGKNLGELREIDVVGPDGLPRKALTLQPVWLDRLYRAVEVGAFERLTISEIVDRILLPPDTSIEIGPIERVVGNIDAGRSSM